MEYHLDMRFVNAKTGSDVYVNKYYDDLNECECAKVTLVEGYLSHGYELKYAMINNIVTCECGNRVSLISNINECATCGLLYNAPGELLNDPSNWRWESI